MVEEDVFSEGALRERGCIYEASQKFSEWRIFCATFRTWSKSILSTFFTQEITISGQHLGELQRCVLIC